MQSSITFPKGFSAGTSACGLKKNGQLDLCVIKSESLASCAGVFTTNVVKGHSLEVCKEHVKKGHARCMYVNAGNANACVGNDGISDAYKICEIIAKSVECLPEEVLPNSTGVIGVRLPMDKISSGISDAISGLSKDGAEDAARAIMTTDTHPKLAQAEIEINGKKN